MRQISPNQLALPFPLKNDTGGESTGTIKSIGPVQPPVSKGN